MLIFLLVDAFHLRFKSGKLLLLAFSALGCLQLGYFLEFLRRGLLANLDTLKDALDLRCQV